MVYLFTISQIEEQNILHFIPPKHVHVIQNSGLSCVPLKAMLKYLQKWTDLQIELHKNNQQKMNLNWLEVGPNLMIGVFAKMGRVGSRLKLNEYISVWEEAKTEARSIQTKHVK